MKKTIALFVLFCVFVFPATLLSACDNRQTATETSRSAITPHITSEGSDSGDELTMQVVEPEDDSASSSASVWMPQIIDLGGSIYIDETEIDDSEKYTYSPYTVSFYNASGLMLREEGDGFGEFTTLENGTIYASTSGSSPFPYGTISCDVKTNYSTDSGIVFGLSNNSNSNTFFEGNGVSYYFFFLGQNGTVMLGKTDNGKWFTLKNLNYSFSDDYHNMKVVFKGSKIFCYVDNVLLFAYRDKDRLTGTGFGLRSGIADVSFKNLSITNEYLYR